MLSGKTCLITGGASPRGIGFATARLFAEHGGRVAIADISGTGAEEAARSLGDGHLGLACDVTSRKDCNDAVSLASDRLGPIDILVNNAGITQPLKVMDIAEADYEKVSDVSLRGTLLMSQAVIPGMRARKAGTIICMSSVSAQRGGGIFGGPHYSAAKAGVLGLARAMARELGPDGIRVNAITPGLIQTDITAGKLTDEMRAEIRRSIPLDRLGDAIDVARICLFLASDLSSYVTGATIDVTGGMLIHRARPARTETKGSR